MLIRAGRIVDPSQNLDALRDIRLADALVVEIGEHLNATDGERVVDARGCIVAPGFIDMHVHLRDPGFPNKETIESGTLAAVRGGFTAVACMPNTSPPLDAPETLDRLRARVRRDAHARVYPIAAITLGRRGETPVAFADLTIAGAVAFSDDGSTPMNARILRDAALASGDATGMFISHCEDDDLKANAVMHEGATSAQLGMPGASSLCEESIIARDALIARETGKAWHIAHCSTGLGIDLVQFARERGARISCEVTPHHLVFSDESVRDLGAGAKVNPPLRPAHDTAALRDAVRKGLVDVFASDHAPHTAAEKQTTLLDAAVGFSGLEIAVGAYAYALPDLALDRFVAMLSTKPAQLLGVGGGTLCVGSPADLTIFAERDWRVDPEQFASKGKSTPFAGMHLPRRVVATIVAGEIAFEEHANE